MRVRLLKAAQLEMDDSYDYYEEQQPGLGNDFILEILATIKRIKQNIEAWAIFSERTRRCLVNRFPYGVIYQARDDEILIIAIAHLHRKPGYWKDRIKE